MAVFIWQSLQLACAYFVVAKHRGHMIEEESTGYQPNLCCHFVEMIFILKWNYFLQLFFLNRRLGAVSHNVLGCTTQTYLSLSAHLLVSGASIFSQSFFWIQTIQPLVSQAMGSVLSWWMSVFFLLGRLAATVHYDWHGPKSVDDMTDDGSQHGTFCNFFFFNTRFVKSFSVFIARVHAFFVNE